MLLFKKRCTNKKRNKNSWKLKQEQKFQMKKCIMERKQLTINSLIQRKGQGNSLECAADKIFES